MDIVLCGMFISIQGRLLQCYQFPSTSHPFLFLSVVDLDRLHDFQFPYGRLIILEQISRFQTLWLVRAQGCPACRCRGCTCSKFSKVRCQSLLGLHKEILSRLNTPVQDKSSSHTPNSLIIDPMIQSLDSRHYSQG